MKNLPESEVYEEELKYMPYKESLRKVINIICSKSPVNGNVLDLMCGPGYLLGQIAIQRKDLHLKGMDLDEKYIDHSKKKYPEIDFEVGDILLWKPKKQFDVVMCTGSLHHIPYEKQEQVIKSILSMVKPGGFCLISDCHVDDYSNEEERKVAAAKLGYEYLIETIKNGAPIEVIKATIDILYNDVVMDEFKTSLKERLSILKKYFNDVEVFKTWPKEESQYGDYCIVCRNK